ncbi:MAG: alkyl hydroperoxide reductase subunit F [Bacteroidetes bacterium]|nr:alkyl hydroperoxide reductase subunit F [Bacteroidota bacterium]
MLDQTIKSQVSELFARLNSHYQFRILAGPAHPNREELITLLSEVASCSEKTTVQISEGTGLSFVIMKDGQATPVVFRMIPTGHEFTTLLLAVLNLDGIGKNLPDDLLQARIRALPGPIQIKSYVSLTCTNCPDVVQALNVLSFLNPGIQHEILDGGLHQSEIEKLGIQAVPSVYVNGTLFHVGRSTLGELLSKLEDHLNVTGTSPAGTVQQFDVLVAGGGPAGVSAAIYAARKGFSVAIVANAIGGQVNETLAIENLISVPQTTGSQLAGNLRQHLSEYPITILENRLIESAEVVHGVKHLTTSLGETLKAPALIIATGASWRRLNVPGEKEHIGAGVAFCTHCEGPFYKGRKVVVIGGGNSGLEGGIDLSSIASEVTLLEFLPELKGDQILQEKLRSKPNVRIVTSAQTLRIEGTNGKVTGLVFKHRETGEEELLEADGVFVQIGLSANSSVFKSLVEVNRAGEILVDAHCRTNVPGIYAAGDVSVVPYKQIVVAMGEGAKAALSAFEDTIKGNLGVMQTSEATLAQ